MKIKNFELLLNTFQEFQKNHINYNLQDFDFHFRIFGDRSYHIELEFAYFPSVSILICPDENLEIENWIEVYGSLEKNQRKIIIDWIKSYKEIF